MNDIEKLKQVLAKNLELIPFSIEDGAYSIEPLGSGESNDNYLMISGPDSLVLRVAKGRHNRLDKEFKTLKSLPVGVGPATYFYSDDEGFHVLAEEYVGGEHLEEWSDEYIKRLVEVVSEVHKITANFAEIRDNKVQTIVLEDYLQVINKPFVESVDVSHIKDLSADIVEFCKKKQPLLNDLSRYSLIHGDLAPINSLYSHSTNQIRLIDWEFAQHFDPARDFATFFYNGVSFNKGKWRVLFDDRQQKLLVSEYEKLTGDNIGDRLRIWLELDKYNSIVWLNWKIQTFDSNTRETLSKDELQNEFNTLLGAMSID